MQSHELISKIDSHSLTHSQGNHGKEQQLKNNKPVSLTISMFCFNYFPFIISNNNNNNILIYLLSFTKFNLIPIYTIYYYYLFLLCNNNR